MSTLKKVAAGLLVLIALVWGAAALFPAFFYELNIRYQLWASDVESIQSAGLHGYRKSTCQFKSDKPCVCVALVHGLGDDALTWRRLLSYTEKEWAGRFDLYAFDLPGAGRTPRAQLSEDYRARRQAAALKAALQPFCKSWQVVGNSFGGWVSLWLALDWKEGVNRLILLGSAGLKPTASEEGERSALKLLTEPTIEGLKEFQNRAYFKPRPLSDSVWRLVLERMKSGESAVPEIVAAQTPDDYLDGYLASVRVPTLILWGKADRIIPLERGKRLQALIPGAVLQEIEHCGHLPQKECPEVVLKSVHVMANYGIM